jgi:uncharacterized protein (DUF2249 family)
MRFLLSLKRMALDESLLVVCDHDPSGLLGELRSVLEKEFTCRVTENGPENWWISISRPEDRRHIKGE